MLRGVQPTMRIACVEAMEQSGIYGYRLLMDKFQNEAYAAVFMFGNRLVLARIPNRWADMLEVHIAEFEQRL